MGLKTLTIRNEKVRCQLVPKYWQKGDVQTRVGPNGFLLRFEKFQPVSKLTNCFVFRYYLVHGLCQNATIIKCFEVDRVCLDLINSQVISSHGNPQMR